MAVFYNKSVL